MAIIIKASTIKHGSKEKYSIIIWFFFATVFSHFYIKKTFSPFIGFSGCNLHKQWSSQVYNTFVPWRRKTNKITWFTFRREATMKLAVDKFSGTIEGNPEVGPFKLMAGIAFSQPMHLLYARAASFRKWSHFQRIRNKIGYIELSLQLYKFKEKLFSFSFSFSPFDCSITLFFINFSFGKKENLAK